MTGRGAPLRSSGAGRQSLTPPAPGCFICASLNLEQPVNGPPKVMPPLIPVVMPMIIVWIITVLVVATRVIATRVVATRVVAIGGIAIGVVDIRIGINISYLKPLRVGWNDTPHQRRKHQDAHQRQGNNSFLKSLVIHISSFRSRLKTLSDNELLLSFVSSARRRPHFPLYLKATYYVHYAPTDGRRKAREMLALHILTN